MAVNREPIYAATPFQATERMKDQVTPRIITTQIPISVKEFGEYGGFIHCIQALPLGDNIASVLFVYIQLLNEEGYHLIQEVNLPAVTSTTVAAAITPVEATLPKVRTSGSSDRYVIDIPASAEIYLSLGTAVANGYRVNIYGGEY